MAKEDMCLPVMCNKVRSKVNYIEYRAIHLGTHLQSEPKRVNLESFIFQSSEPVQAVDAQFLIITR